MNSMSLSKADIETILINLNASKEDLCNRGLWNIAEEYQQLIHKILVNFADTLGEKVNEYVTELSPAAEPEQKWIPVSERLPEKETKVLVCSDTGNMEVCGGSMSTEMPGEWIWYISGWRFGEVVAWMPLPEPAIIGDVK